VAQIHSKLHGDKAATTSCCTTMQAAIRIVAHGCRAHRDSHPVPVRLFVRHCGNSLSDSFSSRQANLVLSIAEHHFRMMRIWVAAAASKQPVSRREGFVLSSLCPPKLLSG